MILLLFTKRQIFRLAQTQSICRQQNKCNLTTDALFGMGRKRCGKRRKCWLLAFYPFLTMILTITKKKPLENIVGKGEKAGNQYFLIFLPCFLPIPTRISVFM